MEILISEIENYNEILLDYAFNIYLENKYELIHLDNQKLKFNMNNNKRDNFIKYINYILEHDWEHEEIGYINYLRFNKLKKLNDNRNR